MKSTRNMTREQYSERERERENGGGVEEKLNVKKCKHFAVRTDGCEDMTVLMELFFLQV